jgi:carboxysome shell carbonic anhydrase
MLSRRQQSPRSRGPATRRSAATSRRTPEPQQAASLQRPAPVPPAGDAEAAQAVPASQAPRRPARPAASQGSTRPTRPPRPKPATTVEAVKRRQRQPETAAQSRPRGLSLRAAAGPRPAGGLHPLSDAAANARLYEYESSVKGAFDDIVPVLKKVASERCEPDFVERAQRIARAELGFELPGHILDEAWINGLDMRRLFAWSVFERYRRVSDAFFSDDPLGGLDGADFQRFLQECGFHLMDITPCADGRLAHAISYVLRLPYGPVRRKSYAGSLFDIENTVEKWVETELLRFREGRPNTADEPTRYLKAVVYHFSSVDPAHQGCAAHGSNDEAAAREGWERLRAFRQAVENGFCCGASVDLLLIGMDTDTDAIRVHVPDADGYCDLDHWLDAAKVYEITRGQSAAEGRARIGELVRAHAPGKAAGKGAGGPDDGMVRLVAQLIENNLSQIDYVRQYHGGHYADIGHAERFIGVGIGFEEIQLRNLTYFAYLSTVEEGAKDLDVGIKIFTGLNISRGLPAPIVVRYDYHGSVPGARERAVQHCERIAMALKARYPKLCADGQLHCLRAVRDCDAQAPIEIVGSSLDPAAPAGH